MQQVSICTGSGQTSHQTILEHIRAAAGVFTDYNACRLVVAVTLAQCVIIPAEEATDLVGMVGSQINTSFTTEAIGSKILSHYSFFLIFNLHTVCQTYFPVLNFTKISLITLKFKIASRTKITHDPKYINDESDTTIQICAARRE